MRRDGESVEPNGAAFLRTLLLMMMMMLVSAQPLGPFFPPPLSRFACAHR